MIGVLHYDLHNNRPLWKGIISWYQLLVLICPMGPSIHLQSCSSPDAGWTKKTSPGFEKRSTENPKRQGVFRWCHLVISCHIYPAPQLKDTKIWIIQAQLHWANGDHPSYEQNLIALNWPWETMMLHKLKYIVISAGLPTSPVYFP